MVHETNTVLISFSKYLSLPTDIVKEIICLFSLSILTKGKKNKREIRKKIWISGHFSLESAKYHFN